MVSQGRNRWALPFCCVGMFFLTAMTVLAAEPAPAVPTGEERFPLDYASPPLIPVKALGTHSPFVLDTGAGLIIVDVSFLSQLNNTKQEVDVTFSASKKPLALFASPLFEIGIKNPQRFQSETGILCGETEPFRIASGKKIQGVIGMDFLKSRILSLNFDEGHFTFGKLPNREFTHVGKIQSGKDVPEIRLLVSEQGYESFTLDTGSSGSLSMNQQLLDNHIRSQRFAVRKDMLTATGDGIHEVRSGILDYVTLGPHQFCNVKVNEGTGNSIGMQFLQRFNVELDFPNSEARFQPSKNFARPERTARLGVAAGWMGSQYQVTRVDANSLAEKGGLRVKDVILKVNGVPREEISIGKFMQLVSEPDSDLKLTIEREGKQHELTFHLVREPDPFPNKVVRKNVKPIPD